MAGSAQKVVSWLANSATCARPQRNLPQMHGGMSGPRDEATSHVDAEENRSWQESMVSPTSLPSQDAERHVEVTGCTREGNPADGHCFWHAVRNCTGEDPATARQSVAIWLANNPEHPAWATTTSLLNAGLTTEWQVNASVQAFPEAFKDGLCVMHAPSNTAVWYQPCTEPTVLTCCTRRRPLLAWAILRGSREATATTAVALRNRAFQTVSSTLPRVLGGMLRPIIIDADAEVGEGSQTTHATAAALHAAGIQDVRTCEAAALAYPHDVDAAFWMDAHRAADGNGAVVGQPMQTSPRERASRQ